MTFEKWPRRLLVLMSLSLAAGCADHKPVPPPPPSAPPPFYIAGGAGSERGNFASHPDTETTGPGGVHCVTYVWDRPLTSLTALRLRSASCEQPDHPGLYIAHEVERMVITMSSSMLEQPD